MVRAELCCEFLCLSFIRLHKFMGRNLHNLVPTDGEQISRKGTESQGCSSLIQGNFCYHALLLQIPPQHWLQQYGRCTAYNTTKEKLSIILLNFWVEIRKGGKLASAAEQTSSSRAPGWQHASCSL